MNARTFLDRFLRIGAFVLFLVAVGTVGFLQFPEWTLSDALYMTWITLTAVGYQEVRPLTDAGRLLVAFLLAGGVTSMGLYFALITSALVEMDLADVFRNRQRMKEIAAMDDHVIVCGAGRTGTQVVRELKDARADYVVLEQDAARAERVRELTSGAVVLVRDATRDESLGEAGIGRARGLVAALSTDEDNLYVTLSARDLNPELDIVARAQEEETMDKLYRAGADHVVSPNITGGARMAAALLRPTVMSFLDVVARGEELSLRLEEVEIPAGSPLAGLTLQEARIPQKTGLIVIAMRRGPAHGDGDIRYNPGPGEEIEAGDVLIVLGTREQTDRLQETVGR